MTIQWGDAAAWAAALMTGGALIAVLVQIRMERNARIAAEQSELMRS